MCTYLSFFLTIFSLLLYVFIFILPPLYYSYVSLFSSLSSFILYFYFASLFLYGFFFIPLFMFITFLISFSLFPSYTSTFGCGQRDGRNPKDHSISQLDAFCIHIHEVYLVDIPSNAIRCMKKTRNHLK